MLIGAAVALWIAGQSLGWWEPVVASIVIAATLALCALFLIGRTAYDVGLDLNRTHVVVGERAVGALTLANTGRRAILPSRVVLPVGAGRGVFSVGRLAAGASAEELFAIPTHRRGIVEGRPRERRARRSARARSSACTAATSRSTFSCHPRTVLFEGQSLGFLRDLEGLPATDLSPDDVSFHALREYQPGDDLRHVHWKSTARTGSVMVRQYEETRRSHFVIGLSRHPGDYRTPDEFELAISVAGSLGLRALRDSQRVEVRVQGRSLPAASGKQFLDSLSGLEPSRSREGDLVGWPASFRRRSRSPAWWCSCAAAPSTRRRLRVACSRLPYGARTLAVVADSGASPSLRRIADADVVTVGALDQLPGALRKVLA